MRRFFAFAVILLSGCASIKFDIAHTKPNVSIGEEDAALYMDSNGFTKNEDYYVFTRRGKTKSTTGEPTGSPSYCRYELATSKEDCFDLDPKGLGASGGVVGGNSLFFNYYGKNLGVYEVDVIKKSAPVKIFDFPENVRGKKGSYKIYPVSATLDGNTVLVTFQDDMPVDRGTKLNAWHDAFMQSGAHAYMYIGNRTSEGWKFEKLYEQDDISKGWIGHAQLNPQTGKDVYFELDGDCKVVEQRGWMIDVITKQISKVYPEKDASVCTTHGNYVKNGIVQIQEYYRGPADKLQQSLVVIANTKTGRIEKYPVGIQMHLQLFERNGTYFVFGDGGNYSSNSITRYEISNGKVIDDVFVASHGSNTAWEAYHQHLRLSPSGKWAVFGDSSWSGSGNVVFVKDPLKIK